MTKQYKEMSKISYSGDIYKNTVAISIKSSKEDVTVSESTCECNFHYPVVIYSSSENIRICLPLINVSSNHDGPKLITRKTT